MRYLVSEVYFKAYFMVDNDNQRITYDTQEMHEYLNKVNKAVEDSVITKEVVTTIGDQFAFIIIDESNGLTLLEQMYEEEYITIEAMRVLADDEYGLFSEDFRARVRSLIR
jgi:wyosine [tRNA(Phe)-imidazoG37] synthetase (radical SAM superfamily)